MRELALDNPINTTLALCIRASLFWEQKKDWVSYPLPSMHHTMVSYCVLLHGRNNTEEIFCQPKLQGFSCNKKEENFFIVPDDIILTIPLVCGSSYYISL